MAGLRTLQQVLSGLRLRLLSPERQADYFRSRGVHIGQGCRLLSTDFGSEPYLVSIGDETLVGPGVQFLTHDAGTWVFRKEHPLSGRFGRITVGDRVFIGARAILLPGVSIGDGSVVGAGAVVTKDVAAGVVVAGVPARVVSTVADYRERTLRDYPALEPAAAGRDRTPDELREQLERLYPLT